MLLQSLIDYGENNYQDVHSRLTTTPIEDLTDEEFINEYIITFNKTMLDYKNCSYNYLESVGLDKARGIDTINEHFYKDTPKDEIALTIFNTNKLIIMRTIMMILVNVIFVGKFILSP